MVPGRLPCWRDWILSGNDLECALVFIACSMYSMAVFIFTLSHFMSYCYMVTCCYLLLPVVTLGYFLLFSVTPATFSLSFHGLSIAFGRLPTPRQRSDGSDRSGGKPLFDTQDMALWWAEKLDFSMLGGPYGDLARALGSCRLDLVAFSNGPRKYVLRVLKELGLDDVFPCHKVFAVDDVLPACKPEKEAFEKVLDSIGVKNPSECIMVEDSMKNIRAAKELGMRTVFISGLNGDPIVDDPAVDLQIETVIELRSALPGLWGD